MSGVGRQASDRFWRNALACLSGIESPLSVDSGPFAYRIRVHKKAPIATHDAKIAIPTQITLRRCSGVMVAPLRWRSHARNYVPVGGPVGHDRNPTLPTFGADETVAAAEIDTSRFRFVERQFLVGKASPVHAAQTLAPDDKAGHAVRSTFGQRRGWLGRGVSVAAHGRYGIRVVGREGAGLSNAQRSGPAAAGTGRSCGG